MQRDNFGSRGMNVRLRSDGRAVNHRSKTGIYLAAAALVLIINLMVSLMFTTGGFFRVMEVSVSSEYLTIYSGDSYALSADARTRGEGFASYSWTSSDPSIITVDSSGRVTAVSEGKAVITVTEANSQETAQCAVTVLPLSNMKLNMTACELGVGESAALSAATDGSAVQYSSDNSSVASVGADGVITATGTGTANITATSVGYGTRTCIVTVLNAPTVININSSLDICVGESRPMSVSAGEGEHCSAFELSCPDSGVISVSEDGVITANSTGTAQLSVTAYNGVTVTAQVKVTNAPTSVSVKAEDSTTHTGQTVQLTPKDNTGACEQFTYSSSDTSIATVDEKGRVTAHKKGSATIICTSFNGISSSCKISVSIVDHTTPYTSERVALNVKNFAESYPELISTGVIGQSTCGTDIQLVKMGKGEKEAIITGGIHAREDITVNFVLRCIELYADTYYSSSGKLGTFNMKNLLDEWTLYIIPCMNPDGLDIANDGMQPLWKDEPLTQTEYFEYKNTATGVNLNRNFPFMWGYDDPTINTKTPDYDSYAGDSEASEPETQAIMKLCSEHDFQWMFSIHVQGNMIYWADSINPNAEKAEYLANRLVVNCKYNLMRNSTIAGASGGMENWFRSEYKKPGFCIELIEDKWSTEVNQYFDKKVNWAKTRYTFVYGMVYG